MDAALGRRRKPRGEQRSLRPAAHLLQEAFSLQKPLGCVVQLLTLARQDVYPSIDLPVRRCTRAALAAGLEAHPAADPPELRVVFRQTRESTSPRWVCKHHAQDATRAQPQVFWARSCRGVKNEPARASKFAFTLIVDAHTHRTVHRSRVTTLPTRRCKCGRACPALTPGASPRWLGAQRPLELAEQGFEVRRAPGLVEIAPLELLEQDVRLG